MNKHYSIVLYWGEIQKERWYQNKYNTLKCLLFSCGETVASNSWMLALHCVKSKQATNPPPRTPSYFTSVTDLQLSGRPGLSWELSASWPAGLSDSRSQSPEPKSRHTQYFTENKIPAQIWSSSPMTVRIKIPIPTYSIQSCTYLDSRSKTTLWGGERWVGGGCWAFQFRLEVN